MREVINFAAGEAAEELLLLWLSFEAEQIFPIEEDEFDPSVIWRGQDQIVPRAVLVGQDRKLQGLQCINSRRAQAYPRLSEGAALLRQGQIITPEFPQEIQQHSWAQYLTYNLRASHYCHVPFPAPPSMVMSSQLLSASLREGIEDSLRKELQACERPTGMLNWASCDDGWAGVSSFSIELFKQLCPKSRCVTFSITKAKQQDQRVQALNKVTALTDLCQKSDLYLPIDYSQLEFPFVIGNEDPLLASKCLLPLLSCFGTSFKIRNGWDFSNFVDNLVQLRYRNIFNCNYLIPLLKDSAPSTPQDDIFKYSANGSCRLRPVLFEPSHVRYSQYFSLRGTVPLQARVGSFALDFKMTDQIFSIPDHLATTFVKKLQPTYSTCFPFHACFHSSNAERTALGAVAEDCRWLRKCKLPQSWVEQLQMEQWGGTLDELVQAHSESM